MCALNLLNLIKELMFYKMSYTSIFGGGGVNVEGNPSYLFLRKKGAGRAQQVKHRISSPNDTI